MGVLYSIGLALVLGITLINGGLYAWRARLLRRLPLCEVPDKLGLIDAVRAFTRECLALVMTIFLQPMGCLMHRCRSGAGQRGPLILVAGRMNRAGFWLLRRRLLHEGWSPVCCFGFFGSDAERAAAQLRSFIQKIGEHRPLMLIAHGAGGLVLRYYLRRYPGPNIRRVVLLGMPHRGTALARLSGGTLAPGSRLITMLNTGDRVPQQCDTIAIHSSFDAVVLPPSNAEYPGAFNIQLHDVGHTALLFSPKVYRLIAENLSAPLT